jgi:spore germination protein KA/spore germination protein
MQRAVRRYDNIIDRVKSKNLEIGERQITYASGSITVFYVKQLTDRISLSELVIKPLMQCPKDQPLKAAQVIESVVFADDCVVDNDDSRIEQHILNGMTVLLFSGDNEYAVINLKQVEKRGTTEPVMTYTVRGPRDALVENLDSNLSLIRYRLKSESLRVDMMQVGRRNHTAVAVIYFEDIANNTCVSEVKKRIGQIDVDGLSSSGELQAYLLNSKASLFPQMGAVERSDMACAAILEGKVVVIMDGSPWGLIAPKVFSEYLWTCDDFYLSKYMGTFLRVLRVISLNLAFIVSSLYVAIVAYHSDVLPSAFMIAIAQARARVPFTALVEVLLIELIAEIIRESLIRVPTKIGTAIGIVGAIIIGQAAVAAGVFSPLMLIVISLSLISSFVPSDYTLMDAFRVLKFLLIIATGTFGFYGFTLVIIFVLAQLVSINTFGVPYMAPLAPFSMKDIAKTVVYSKTMAPHRAAFLRTKDNTRGPTGNDSKKKPDASSE